MISYDNFQADMVHLLVQVIRQFVVPQSDGATPNFRVAYTNPNATTPDDLKGLIFIHQMTTGTTEAATVGGCQERREVTFRIGCKQPCGRDMDNDTYFKQVGWLQALFSPVSGGRETFDVTYRGTPYTGATWSTFGVTIEDQGTEIELPDLKCYKPYKEWLITLSLTFKATAGIPLNLL